MSKPKHIYTPLDTPNLRRLAEIEDLIQRWRSTGELFLDLPEVTNTLKEYDDLQNKEHPVLSNPLSFHNENWDTPTNEDD